MVQAENDWHLEFSKRDHCIYKAKHILALTISPLCAMQLRTAVIEGEMIVCLHQMFVTNVMVQNVHQEKRWNQQSDSTSEKEQFAESVVYTDIYFVGAVSERTDVAVIR